MYICNACGGTSQPGQPSNSWITKKRKRNYELLDKEGGRVGVVSGWEIKREIKLCDSCFDEAQKAEEYRSQADGS